MRWYRVFALRRQPNFYGAPAAQRISSGAMHLRERLLRQQTHFDGADQFLLVAWRNLFRRSRIHPLQNAMQMPRRMRRDAGPQPLAQLFRPQRHIGQPFEQRAQIKPRAHGKNRQPLSCAKIFEHGNGPLAITSRGGLLPAGPAHQSDDAPRPAALRPWASPCRHQTRDRAAWNRKPPLRRQAPAPATPPAPIFPKRLVQQ